MKKKTLERQAFFAGEKLDYRIEFRKRSSLSVTVYPDRTVILRVPKHISLKGAEEFFSSKVGWIEEKLKRHPRLPAIATRDFPFLGDVYRLPGSVVGIGNMEDHTPLSSRDEVEKPQNGTRKQKKGNILPIQLGPNAPADESALRKKINAWYMKEAKRILPSIFDDTFAKHSHHLPKAELKLRKMKSRWGSCSNKRKITLNSELIKLPRDCIEYIIIHEMAHLKILNHSKSFYEFMSVMLPNWKDKEAQLKRFARSPLYLGSLI